MPKAITSLTGYVRKIADLSQNNRGSQIIFRGHDDKSYELFPSVFRKPGWRENEDLMIRGIIAKHPGEFQADSTLFERLVRAQHYGLPTRLLDMTFNPLVALYFSCINKRNVTGRVICAFPNPEKQKFYDSDAVSLLSNLSLLKAREKESLISEVDSIYSEDSSGPIRPISPSDGPTIAKLCELISCEKPYTFNRIIARDLAIPVSVVPKKSHARIMAQDGAFLLFGLFGTNIEEIRKYAKIDMMNIDIHHDAKSRILSELESVGVSEETLFPEIEKSAGMLKKKFG